MCFFHEMVQEESRDMNIQQTWSRANVQLACYVLGEKLLQFLGVVTLVK